MSADENVAIYRRFAEKVLNKGNVDAADEFFVPTFIDHSLPPDMPGTLDGFKEWLTMFHNAFPDGEWTIDFIAATGDIVARHPCFVGTHRGENLGVAGTAKPIRTRETGIVRFKDGKMVEFWGTFEDFGTARQRGLAPDQ
jgi:predicted ester cyclase